MIHDNNYYASRECPKTSGRTSNNYEDYNNASVLVIIFYTILHLEDFDVCFVVFVCPTGGTVKTNNVELIL